MAISSIDELLLGAGGNSQQPQAPEHQEDDIPLDDDALQEDAPEYEEGEGAEEGAEDPPPTPEDEEGDEPDDKAELEDDEYGNPKERMSKGMKDRLDRKEKQHQREIDQREYEINQLRAQLTQQGASQQVQQAAKDFEYDPEAGGDWQQQLASFVKQTVSSMNKEQEDAQSRQEEARVQLEFETKFRDGMGRFTDFREVIDSLPCEISNPMTLATRSMANPAAFLYAAAKRHPKELERISKIRDPYGQMMEIGKLEERMRKNKPTTKAPRPLGRTQEDATTKVAKKKADHTGDDLLAKADAKRLAVVRQRHRGSR